jgi:hypothetical protein
LRQQHRRSGEIVALDRAFEARNNSFGRIALDFLGWPQGEQRLGPFNGVAGPVAGRLAGAARKDVGDGCLEAVDHGVRPRQAGGGVGGHRLWYREVG